MSTEAENENLPEEVKPEKVNPSPIDLPKNKVQGIFQELEFMALQKGRSGLDLSKFNDGQIDKIIDVLKQNEDNAFKYHTKRVDAIKDIELAKINAATTNQKTLRIILVTVAIVIPLMTILILFFKPDFFTQWLTILTALLGGVGLSKLFSPVVNIPKHKNPIKEDESSNQGE